MPCFHPWEAWPVMPPGRGITNNPAKSYKGAVAFKLPCNQCIGCRLDRSRDWATRIHHEAQLYADNSFVTLTFSDEHLPDDGSVRKRHLQLFMKRLRKRIGKVRFFACGEYGGRSDRPHYHVIFFGYRPADCKLWRRSATGHYLYRSGILESVWPYGHVEVGDVTVESAGYVARYVTKKVTGKEAEDHYRRVSPTTGQIFDLQPEFICMSTKPGIGRDWYDQYSADAFPSDFVIINGEKRPVPRYYKKQLDDISAIALTSIRKGKAKAHAENNTPERLRVREELQEMRAARLIRKMEEET